MPGFRLASLSAGGFLWASLVGQAAAAPGDKQQAAPVPIQRAPAKQPAPRFQPAPTPGQTDATVRLTAPVPPPYSGTAYRDLGGQPETSADALDSQGPRPR